MDSSGFQIFAATGMVALVVALTVVYRSYLVSGAERRMRRMLLSLGLDPALATQGNADDIMNEVRRRCRHCSSESVCERWLDGVESGGNSFCPNAPVFDAFKEAR